MALVVAAALGLVALAGGSWVLIRTAQGHPFPPEDSENTLPWWYFAWGPIAVGVITLVGVALALLSKD